ncbi:MAG: DNA/RNA nuclease SfsA [Gammaproteobacteria bacterium]|nr:MAG: DNA/RNA nuclease SfsA [Gammaproteobacteria bacterium]
MLKVMELLKIESFFQARVVKRLNRFAVLVKKGEKLLKAHNTNSGRLKEFLTEGKTVLCLPKRGKKTDCKLFAVEDLNGLFAVTDTNLQMVAFEKAFLKGLLPWLSPSRWKLEKKNAPLGENSLIDYLFRERDTGKPLYLEVKSAVLRSSDNFGMYPDCPTERGRKHLRELIENLPHSGLLFICALPSVGGFKPYCKGDEEICKLLKTAKERGLPIRAISLHFNPQKGAIVLENPDLRVEI